MKSLNLRKARPEDESKAKELIYMTGPDLFLYMFGKKAKDVLSYLFQKGDNLFSYEHCNIADVDNEISGMILAYEYEVIENESKNTGRLIIKYYRPGFIFRVINLIKLGRIISDLNKEDYYISNLAVFDKYRGYGVGKRLIDFAIEEAKRLGKSQLSLDVETDNKNAISFYHHLGFKSKGRKTINFGFNRRVSLFRMIRDVM